MSDLTDALAPCPFCGGNARVCRESDADGFGTFAFVQCQTRGCAVRTIGEFYSQGNDDPLTYVQVRDAWNRRAAVRSLQGGGWRPIETAPKDGAVVLFYAPTPHFGNPYVMARADDRLSEWWVHYGYATHWQPLPTPPTKE
jgi:hypothetical protein